jgi:hypothetical protein
MSAKDQIAALRHKAVAAGIRLGMAKLNDALAKALFGRPYAPVVAADRSGAAPPVLPRDSSRLAALEAEYGIAQGSLFRILHPEPLQEAAPHPLDGISFHPRLRYTAEQWLSETPLRELWPEGLTLQQSTDALRSNAPNYGTPDHEREGLCVEGDTDAFLTVILARAKQQPDQLIRPQARELFALGHWDFLDYTYWVSLHDDSHDLEEQSILDGKAIAPISLWIHDSGASTAEIEAGVSAAMAELRLHATSPSSAYLATLIDAAGGSAWEQDLDAWRAAEAAAFRAAFEGWATVPHGANLGRA